MINAKKRGGFRSTALSGVLASTLTGSANMISGLVVIPIILTSVGAHDYGVWLALSASAALLFYSDLGIGSAIIHYGSVKRGGSCAYTIDSMLTAALAFMFSVWLAVTLIYVLTLTLIIEPRGMLEGIDSGDRTVLVAASSSLLLALLLKPFESTLIGSGHLVRERRYQFYASLYRVLATYLVCLTAPSIAAIAVVEVIFMLAPLVCCLFSVRALKIARVTQQSFNAQVLRALLSYGGRAFAVAAVGAAILQSGTFLVAATSGASSVPFYTAASRIYGGLRQIVSWTSDPFRPVLSRMWAANPKSAVDAVAAYSFLTILVAQTSIVSVGLMAYDLTKLWLGGKGVQADVPIAVIWLIAGLAMNVLHIPLVAATDARGRPGITFPYQIAWLIAYLLLGSTLGNYYGLVGVSVAMVIPLVILEPLIVLSACRAISLSYRDWLRLVLLPVVLILGPAALVSILLRASTLPASGFISAGLSLGSTLLIILVARRRLPFNQISTALKERL